MEQAQSRFLPLAAGLAQSCVMWKLDKMQSHSPIFLMELSSQTPAHAGHSGKGGWRGTKPAD